MYYKAIDLLKGMIARPSFSREEGAVADFLEQAWKADGHLVSRVGNNLYLTTGAIDPQKPTLLLNSHIDTVKPASGWTRDPFFPEETEDDRLYGLGSNDAGASVVSLYAAFCLLMLAVIDCAPEKIEKKKRRGAAIAASCCIWVWIAASFGLVLGNYIASSRFANLDTSGMTVGDFMDTMEDLDRIAYEDAGKLSYSLPPQKISVVPQDRTKYAKRHGVRFFRSRFDVSEPMELRLLLGYDGPVKLFADGAAVYLDRKGINPIIPEQYHVDVKWGKGRHEVMFALALNGGAAWGVSLAIVRTDIRRTKRKSSQEIALPVEVE